VLGLQLGARLRDDGAPGSQAEHREYCGHGVSGHTVIIGALIIWLTGWSSVERLSRLACTSGLFSSGRNVMSTHLVVEPRLLNDPGLLAAINEALEQRFGLTHTTVQLESSEETPPHSP
jgi:Co/Zn/Cd efflux system component